MIVPDVHNEPADATGSQKSELRKLKARLSIPEKAGHLIRHTKTSNLLWHTLPSTRGRLDFQRPSSGDGHGAFDVNGAFGGICYSIPMHNMYAEMYACMCVYVYIYIYIHIYI